MADDAVEYAITAGCYLARGGREYQEDRISIKRNLNGSSNHYFGVFDGHGGHAISHYLSRNFHISLAQHAKFSLMPIAALQECWSQMDDQCYQELRRVQNDDMLPAFPADGSTGTVCCIIGTDIYLTNCGDSAAYSVMDGGSYEKLTEDHGTHNPSEVKRCELMGGKLKQESYHVRLPFPLCCCRREASSSKPRIYPGGLLVTRAFGDFYAKKEWLGGRPGVVIPQHGNISYINLQRSSLKYLIIASDGVWDVMTIEEVMAILQQTISNSKRKPTSNTASAKVNMVKVSPTESQKGDESTTSGGVKSSVDLKEIISGGFVSAVAEDLDSVLSSAAQRVINTAVTSKNWAKLGCKSDNACCIIVSIEQGGGDVRDSATTT